MSDLDRDYDTETGRSPRQRAIEAYESAKHDENGFAALSVVGGRAGNKSSFDARSFGYKGLADLVRAIPGFEVVSRENLMFVRFKK